MPKRNFSISVCIRDPAQRQEAQGQLLEPWIGATTVAVRVEVWDAFTAWLRKELSEKTVVSLFKRPPLLALVLRDYADKLYKVGASLGNYRQLLAHAQKVVPFLRPHLKVAMEMVTRWGSLQPVVHRTPCRRHFCGPCEASKWKRWAAVTLAAFYLIARPGEACRQRGGMY